MSSLGRNQHFLTAKELMNRWGISELDLIAILSEYELRFQDSGDLTTYAYDDRMLKTKYIYMMAFALIDVELYERRHPEYKPQEDPELEPLNGRESRELGQLRKEKLKWDESLKAAVHIGIFCSNKKDGSVTKAMVYDELNKYDSSLQESTIERIRNAIPDKCRKGSGRPPKDSQKNN